MKFDGYYALSDFLEVPNLRQKSYAALKHHAAQWFWGTETSAPGPTGLRGLWFTLYAVAATVYGWMVTILMVWFLTKFLQPYKLTVVGWGLATLAAFNIIVLPIVMGVVAARRNPSLLRPKPWWRPVLTAAVLVTIIWGVLFIPLPRRVYAVLTIEPTRSQQVSVTVPGQILTILVQPGQSVRQGDPLLELDNVELRLLQARLEQERELFQVQWRAAEASQNPARSRQLRVLIEAVESQLALQQSRLDKLQVRAPCDGLVIPEPEQRPLASRGSPHEVQLARGTHSPLNRENVGAVLDAGTPVCRIVESPEYEAVAILPQSQIESVRVGQPVTIKLDAFPGDMLLGTVREIGVQDVTNPPPQLLNVAGSELPAVTSGPGAGGLVSPHYQVRVTLTGFSHQEFAKSLPPLRVGLRGRVWIQAGSQTLALRGWHWLCEAFQN
ncbi:MAG: HlyD family efflux transporter periplasmic adaptor subunit [Candidatus Saccharimonas sp.]|nr:HlyD family efflux transporter periplasmic adaptor subunit [Planctomycetaceae bacterium]